jgi:hypothetical protein
MTTPQYSTNTAIVSSPGILAGYTFRLSAYTPRYFVTFGIGGFILGCIGTVIDGIDGITAAGAKPGLIN